MFFERKYVSLVVLVMGLGLTGASFPAKCQEVEHSPVGYGWSSTSVNAVIFRRNSITSLNETQYISFYDTAGFVVLGKRLLPAGEWDLHRTQWKGNVRDAHNSISIMVDGEGFLHVSWDHHNQPLHYARGLMPGSLQMGEMIPMIGRSEQRVTYPEFHRMPSGDLLFLYRDGESGNGNLVVNYYSAKQQTWRRVQETLIGGEGIRNAYWQACVDSKGVIHLSWVWRESPDVASNHDICYARSHDGGITWENSKGNRYDLPIIESTAELAVAVQQRHELINQTSITTNERGVPFIATYWRDTNSSIPTYRIIYKKGSRWRVVSLPARENPFTLSGAGTKRIPISRPLVMARGWSVWVIYRDEERGSKATVTHSRDIRKLSWDTQDLTAYSLNSWEPTFDGDRWKSDNTISLFVQCVGQGDGEQMENIGLSEVSVVSFLPK